MDGCFSRVRAKWWVDSMYLDVFFPVLGKKFPNMLEITLPWICDLKMLRKTINTLSQMVVKFDGDEQNDPNS